jgi:hypothetical protein
MELIYGDVGVPSPAGKRRAKPASQYSRRRGLCACVSSCCQQRGIVLLESIESGAVAALKGSWLVKLKETGGHLTRRQELPLEAFWQPWELRRLVRNLGEHYGAAFVALSARWLSPEQADVDNWHLHIVASIAKLYLGRSGYFSRSAAAKSPLADAFRQAGLDEADADFALFWDFASLHQHPRNNEEERAFAAGLRASSAWFSDAAAVCWLQTELPSGFDGVSFFTSGWCFVEAHTAALSSMNNGSRLLDLGRRTAQALRKAYGGEEGWADDDCLDRVCATRLPPRTPVSMWSALESGKRFSDAADAPLVLQSYTSAFDAFAASTDTMELGDVGWGSAEIALLCECLPSMTSLTSLDLSHNRLGRAGADLLCAALVPPKPPSALVRLDMSSTGLGPSGAVALAVGLAACRSLSWLDLSRNELKDEGIEALAAALGSEGGGGCALSTLALNTNEVRAGGAAALARLCATTSIATLELGDNLLKDEGARAIADVLSGRFRLAGRHHLRSLDVRSNGIGPKGSEELRKCRIETLTLGTLIHPSRLLVG